MSLFDFLKRKKTEEKPEKRAIKKEKKEKKEKKAPAIKAEKPKIKKEEKKEEVLTPIITPVKKKIPGSAYGILHFPHITEKATDLEEQNKYIFKVWQGVNKTQIKKAVENNYGVNVIGVNIINIKGKKIRLGRQEGQKKGYKKAIVKIKEGQKIEVLPR